MSASRWSHNFTCCSDKCGDELGLLIEKNVNSAEYKNIYKEYSKLEKQRIKLVDKLDSIVKKDFKSEVIEFSIGNDVRVKTPKGKSCFGKASR